VLPHDEDGKLLILLFLLVCMELGLMGYLFHEAVEMCWVLSLVVIYNRNKDSSYAIC